MSTAFTAEVLFWLAVLFPLPVYLLSLLRPLVRLLFGIAGALAAVGIEAMVGATGAEDPRMLVAAMGAILAIDAMVAEIVYRLRRRLRARRSDAE